MVLKTIGGSVFFIYIIFFTGAEIALGRIWSGILKSAKDTPTQLDCRITWVLKVFFGSTSVIIDRHCGLVSSSGAGAAGLPAGQASSARCFASQPRPEGPIRDAPRCWVKSILEK
jgi:hypothetical protein